jgi:hypothetical protein
MAPPLTSESPCCKVMLRSRKVMRTGEEVTFQGAGVQNDASATIDRDIAEVDDLEDSES